MVENGRRRHLVDIGHYKQGLHNEWVMVGREALSILLLSLWAKDTVRREMRHAQPKSWLRNSASEARAADENAPTIISTTKIELPADIKNDIEHGQAGRNILPHLRRGHAHTVVHGNGRSLRTVKWFAPTWVGVDPDFAKSRQYCVKR